MESGIGIFHHLEFQVYQVQRQTTEGDQKRKQATFAEYKNQDEHAGLNSKEHNMKQLDLY